MLTPFFIGCEFQILNEQAYKTPSSAGGVCILHAQVESSTEEEPKVNLPPFLDVERRLHGPADENEYGAYSLSLIN
jgi:hypothetical protein